tara:strand:+ start:8518 stop:8973 length:456 start_codon:yes stop_codon:yes gene_type:complete
MMQESLQMQMNMLKMQEAGYQATIQSLQKEGGEKEDRIDKLRGAIDLCRRQRNKCEREKLRFRQELGEGGAAAAAAAPSDEPDMGRPGTVMRRGDGRFNRPRDPPFFEGGTGVTNSRFRRSTTEQGRQKQRKSGRRAAGIGSRYVYPVVEN